LKFNFGTIIFGVIMYNVFFGGGDDGDIDIYEEESKPFVATIKDYKDDKPVIQEFIHDAMKMAAKVTIIITEEFTDEEITDESNVKLQEKLDKLNKEIADEEIRIAEAEKKATVKNSDSRFGTSDDLYGSTEDKY